MEEVGDGGHRTYRVEDALCIPGCDSRVENRIRQRKEHFHIVIKGMVISGRDVLGEEIPMSRRKLRVRAVRPVLSDHLLLIGQMSTESYQFLCLLEVFC